MNSVGEEGIVKVWDLRKGRQAWSLQGHESKIRSINFNKNGELFCTGGNDCKVNMWKSCFDINS